MQIVYWGTYDKKRERHRILMDAFEQVGVDVFECHEDVWKGIRDKSMVSSWRSRFRIFAKYIVAYLKLIFKYIRLPNHDAIFVGYMGHFDVLVLWPFAKLRRKPIIWDAIISIYITTIYDRKMLPVSHPFARLIFLIEYLSCHLANRLLLPSYSRALNFTQRYQLAEGRARGVFLGVETQLFPARKRSSSLHIADDTISVLFYGQFIPMHGIDTIVYAARLMRKEPVHWVIIGSGQVAPKIKELLDERPLPRLNWIPWVPYTELSDWIHHADIALGIFGASEKAATSIPNKVFQILSTGTPLITRDSPAIREILHPTMPGIYLVPPESPTAIVDAVREFRSDRKLLDQIDLHRKITESFQPNSIGKQIVSLITECLLSSPKKSRNLLGRPLG
jgi:glycosyltransferase involved in cell wall biosynthesis